MLNIFRRHTEECSHKSRDAKKCQCPIWCDWTVDGKRLMRSMETRDWGVAQSKARVWETEGIADTPRKVVEACDQFIADAKARGLKDASIYKYRILFKQLQAFALAQNIILLTDLTLEKTRLFRESWTNKGQSAKKKLEFLRAFFRFCVDSGWLKTNHAKLIRLPIVADVPVLPFTTKEVEAILAACDSYPDARNKIRLRGLIHLMKSSGLRLGDAVCLARSAITHGQLTLRTAKSGTKVGVPLPPETLEALAAIPKETAHYFWTGTSTRKTVINTWEVVLRNLFDASGVKGAHSHRLRHTFAVNLLLAGVSIESVAVLLGHRSIRITEKHYSQWVKGRQEKLNEDVRKAWVA